MEGITLKIVREKGLSAEAQTRTGQMTNAVLITSFQAS